MLLSRKHDTNLVRIFRLPSLSAGEMLYLKTQTSETKNRRARGSASEHCLRTEPNNDINKHPMPRPATPSTCPQHNKRSHAELKAIATNKDIHMDAGLRRRQSKNSAPMPQCVEFYCVLSRTAHQGFFCTCLGAVRARMWYITATLCANRKSEIFDFVFF